MYNFGTARANIAEILAFENPTKVLNQQKIHTSLNFQMLIPQQYLLWWYQNYTYLKSTQ